jgi:hypothetical protein
MTNPNRSLPTFAVYKNRVLVGIVTAVKEADAHKRAVAKFGRCEVMIAADAKLRRAGRVERSDSSYTHGRSPYAVGDFAARRAAEIARWKAGE